MRFDGRSLSRRSRHGRACADSFPEVAELAETLRGRRIVLDGELVCLASDGKPDFAALRARFGRRGRALSAAQRSPVTLIVFDVLHLDGRATRELPYCKRRELLEELVLDGPAWCTPRHILGGGEGEALIAAIADQGLEGVVAKRLDAPSMAGRRSTAWVKLKHRRGEWFVIAGWRERPGHFLNSCSRVGKARIWSRLGAQASGWMRMGDVPVAGERGSGRSLPLCPSRRS
jgi:bifunctional non-homologous end joining protein LigD